MSKQQQNGYSNSSLQVLMNVGGDKINGGVAEVAFFLKPMAWKSTLLRFTLDGGSRVQTPRNQFELIWCKLDSWVGPCLGP